MRRPVRRGRDRAVGAARGSPRRGLVELREPAGRIDGVDVGFHDLAHEGGLEGVEGVLPHDVKAPAGHLLAQDLPLEHEDADEVGDDGRAEQGQLSEGRMTRDREQRLGRDQVGAGDDHAEGVGGCGRDADEDHRPGLELEGQQLDAEERGRHRGPEDRAHPGGRARDEQASSLGRGEMQELADDRSHRSTRENDRAFGPKRAAGADAPIRSLVGGHVLRTLSPANQAALTGHSFFPALISKPFHSGLTEAFLFAALACLIAALASWSRGSRYVDGGTNDLPAEGSRGGRGKASPAAASIPLGADRTMRSTGSSMAPRCGIGPGRPVTTPAALRAWPHRSRQAGVH